MKKFSIPVVVKGKKQNVIFSVGNPDSTHHPLYFQMEFLAKSGAEILPEFSSSFEKLHQTCVKYKIPFDTMCYYVLRIAKDPDFDHQMPESEFELNIRLKSAIDPTK